MAFQRSNFGLGKAKEVKGTNVRLIASFGLIVTLASCSTGPESVSLLRPSTWFGGNNTATEPVVPTTLAPRDGYQRIYDDRPLVAQVTQVTSERTPGGLIVTATGLPPTQGYAYADLLRAAPTGRELTLEYRIRPPKDQQNVGTVASRQVVTGTFLTNDELAGYSIIRVRAATNSRTTSR